MTDERDSDEARPIPVTEWIVAALGVMLVAGTIGYLVWLAMSRDETPPDVRVVADGVVALQDGWLVQFRAANAGGQAAAEVLIETVVLGFPAAIGAAAARLIL